MKKCWVFGHGIAMKNQSWLSCWFDSGTVFAIWSLEKASGCRYQGVSRSACSPTNFPTPVPKWKSQFIDSPFHGDIFSWGYQSKKFGKVHCEGGWDGKKPEANRVTVCHIQPKKLRIFQLCFVKKVLYFSHQFFGEIAALWKKHGWKLDLFCWILWRRSSHRWSFLDVSPWRSATRARRGGLGTHGEARGDSPHGQVEVEDHQGQWYGWWFRNPVNSPVEGTVVNIPLFHRVF